MNKGKIVQVIGPVVDIQFDADKMPGIYYGLKIENITLEVMGHLGEGIVRAIALSPTEGLIRGMDVVDTGDYIKVPVGKEILGRLINVLGEPIDHKGPIKSNLKYQIHRPSPSFIEQEVETHIFETGIKAIDLLAPFPLPVLQS